MPGIKRYFKTVKSGNSNAKRFKSGNYRSSASIQRPFVRRGRRSFKPRRAFKSIRRHRKRGGSGKGRGLTIAKVLRAITPLNTYSYAVAGKVIVGSSTSVGPACAYYFPCIRAALTTVTYSTATVGTGTTIVNGNSTTQMFPDAIDMTDIGTKIGDIDSNTSIQGSALNFFSPSVKFWAGNYICRTKMVNQNNGQACVTVYTCTLRKNLPTSYNRLYNLMSEAMIEKLSTNDNAYSYVIATNDDFMRDDMLSPYDASKFLGYVKINSSRKFIMNAGDIKVITLTSKAMRLQKPANYTSIGNVSQTATWFGGSQDVHAMKGAVFQFFRVTGQPTNDSTTKTNLGYTSPAIDFVHDYRFQYRFTVNTGSTNSRLGAFGFANVTVPDVMTEQGNVSTAGGNA